jgi:arachidonate 5-lipoxygenase
MSTWTKEVELWAKSTVFVAGLVTMRSIRDRRRMSHDSGVVAAGRIKIVDDPKFPAHDFFVPGREFPARIRHASTTYDDDTRLQVRSASLKFADTDWESPLDIEMNTGRTSLFWSVNNFIEFAELEHPTDTPITAREGLMEGITFRSFYEKYPQGFAAAKEGVRDPSSFELCHFYSQTPTLFIDRTFKRFYARYRLLPEDRTAPEAGIVSAERLDRVYDSTPDLDDPRPPNYLKQAYRDRLDRGPVVYHLQIQLRAAKSDDPADEDQEIFNSNWYWDDTDENKLLFPWLDLATVTIDQKLPHDQNVFTRTSVANAPRSLQIIPARDLDDYNSLNYLRALTTPVKRVRVLMHKIFGVPPELTTRAEVAQRDRERKKRE